MLYKINGLKISITSILIFYYNILYIINNYIPDNKRKLGREYLEWQSS